jgi:putative NADH-flavin reductase
MKITLYGATGMIGSRILTEALHRGHSVVAVVRDPAKLSVMDDKLTVVKGDITDEADVRKNTAGVDAVVSAFSPRGGDNSVYTSVARTLIAALSDAGTKRIVFVGGAGSLEVAPGVQLVDTPQFPEPYKARALAMRDELAVIRSEAGGLDWSYLSPAAMIQPGERTGKFRLGGDQMVVDESGKSVISAEDFAIAVVDELEHPAHVKQRFTLAY